MKDSLRERDPDWSNRSNPLIGCLLGVVLISIVIYALFGLFAGYLIIPEIRTGNRGIGKELIIEGTPARIGGGSIILMYIGLFLTRTRNYLNSGWMKPAAIMLFSVGVAGIILTLVLNQYGN
ncbi:MAG: hypothetical protein ACIAXF_04005 [Phycisphaerales bacterium JB063]